jgi:hypothetical protein
MPAIAGDTGWRLADIDGGGAMRTRAFGLVEPLASGGAGVPGPGEAFGLACPG